VEQNPAMARAAVNDPLLRRQEPAPAVDIDRLYRDHRVRLTRLATAITLDRTLAEEVVQDAFAGLHRNATAVTKPLAYLQRSVVNLSIKVLRRRAVASRHTLDPAPVTNVPELDETWDVVTRLPARQRAVVLLRYWEDLSERDIADILGWPAGTVKSTLHRTLRRLKEELEP
jgi:RNA polymerase sigma factor (sigma-70 family)